MLKRRFILFAGNAIAKLIAAFKTRIAADGGIIEAEPCLTQTLNRLQELGLLNQASLIVTPNAVKANKICSIAPSNGSGDLTFTRASTATRVNSSGNIENVATGVPRINYPSAGSCPALLFEPQRTNLLLRSEDFDSASWNKQGTTILANQVAAPDNNNTADLLTDTVTGGAHEISTGVNFISGNRYTLSVFAKASVSNSRLLLLYVGSSSAFPSSERRVWVNVVSGSILQTDTNVTATIENYGNGWYRITATATCNATVGGSTFIALSDAAGNLTYTGTGDRGIYIWGAQLEVGAYPTSYIPTAGSTVTRVTEDCVISAGVNNIAPITGYTLFWDFSFVDDIAASRLAITDGTFNNLVFIGLEPVAGANLGVAGRVRVAGVDLLAQTINVSAGRHKLALQFSQNGASWFVNGVKRNTYAPNAGFVASVLSLGRDFPLTAGAANLTNTFCASIFNQVLSDSQCIALTS